MQAFEEIVALLVYGMVLFPNPDQFIDVNTVKIFIYHNPMPTLLGDILHSFHTRTIRKRGILMCCTPLLARWFISHLPRSVLKNKQVLRWSHRLMTLRHSDGVLDPWRMLLSSTIVENSPMSLCLALDEVSPATPS